MTELKNQHTLFRIVSLRNPERYKKENQHLSFVFHPDNSSGVFFNAVNNKTANQTKWQALTSVTFSGYTSESEIEDLNGTLFKTADWLSRNRQIAKPEEVLERLNGLSKYDDPTEINLWDNLFYKIITDENYYIKEAIIQVLVLQNLLKQIALLATEEEKLNCVITLANAKVVLPTYLFEEEVNVISNNQSKVEASPISIPKSLYVAQEVENAKTQLKQLEEVKKELKKFENKQNVIFQKRYDEALKSYQNTIKPSIEAYKKSYAAAKLALEVAADANNKEPNINLINLPDYPSIPEFTYDQPKEIDHATINSKLSENTNHFFEKMDDWKNMETFKEVYQSIDILEKKAHQIINENTILSKQYASFGDVIFPISKESPSSNFSYVICTKDVTRFKEITLTIQVPDNIQEVSSMYYKVSYQNGDSMTGTVFNSIKNGSIITITNLFGNNFIDNPTNLVNKIEANITFSNNSIYILSINPFDLKMGCRSGVLSIKSQGDTSSNSDNYVPKGFGFRQLGIADYKKVVTEICGYRAGEVAHIENIMAGETREKVTTKTHKSEITQTDSQEIETEKLSDTTSTERFEMQSEIAKMQQEQKQFDAHAQVHASNGTGTLVLDAGANYATNTSREESNRQAVTQAKEQTQRAMERIVSRMKTEKTVKITDEFIEANKHRFENVTNPYNVSGVYRFVNAVYKNQIYNYGKRLMYEFMIPQPSKLHRLGLKVSTSSENAVLLEKPLDPRIAYPSFTSINENNYQTLIAKYNATNVEPFPDLEIYIGKSFDYGNTSVENVKSEKDTIKIPENYFSKAVQLSYIAYTDNQTNNWNHIHVIVGNCKKEIAGNVAQTDSDLFNDINNYKDEVPVSLSYITYYACNISISIKCQLSNEGLSKWKKETYEAILAGYEEQLRQYNEKQAEVKAEGAQYLDSNPLFYRLTEQLVLRKNCISYLLDNTNTNSARRFGIEMYNEDATFNDHQVTINQTMDDYTSFAKFMEQAFEWNLMSYNFYPFYWGKNEDWKELYQFDTNDPIYRAFMQAGMARVVVTVKPGFENAIMHYMSFGQIWNGGQMPILGNPLYLSIVEELKQQEYTIEDVWETVVPTNLVALQESGVAIEGGGLPCAPECQEHQDTSLKLNDKTLAVPATTTNP